LNQIIEALEYDAGWVELYGVTGQLKVPNKPLAEGEEEIRELLEQAKEVRLP
jgi:trafficking protein particle complex subunit 10